MKSTPMPMLPPPPDFIRDVRPILAASCFTCHGADDKARRAGLRLDGPNRAIIPGDVIASEAARRIVAEDSTQMPPSGTGHTLTPVQKQILLRWIDAGAKYEKHWSFKPISVPSPSARGKLDIDPYIQRSLVKAGLNFSPEADRYALARRISLDLTGLPPSPGSEAKSYEQLVDELLASPRFGEKWARPWLDLARFADSAGYGSDPLRPNLWPWRDWVIQALNQNKPYNLFGTELIAGDLLPDASDSTRIATAFHRNTMTNTEGGTDDEEFRTAAVKDRAIVTMQGFMGLTLQCAQCHTHKFDPITQKEFYKFYAIFNQTEDNDQPDERPTLSVYNQAQRERVGWLSGQLERLHAEQARERAKGFVPARYVRVTMPGKNEFLMLAEVQVYSRGSNVSESQKATQSSTDFGGEAKRANDNNTDGNFNNNSVTHTAAQDDPWWEVDLGSVREIDEVRLWPRTDAHLGRMKGLKLTYYDNDHKPVAERVVAEPLMAARTLYPVETELTRNIEELTAEKAAIKPVALPVLKELPHSMQRVSHMLTLGNFLLPGEVVEPGVPAALAGKTPVQNRLELARWIFARENPLTARVAVNRIWAQLFGTGLVETEEDFGLMGALPSHPELLDALAADFQRDWNVKRLIKEIVLSKAYRQASKTTPENLKADPKARLLSRYPRRRLDAEGVRDQALALSGLLSNKIGGPSVFPPQPDGLWKAAFNGERTWPTSMGEDRYRRGIYTFWRRTVPYPSMQTFDAPSRESCILRRQPTNTPLQALVTLNDPAYLEMAQALGKRIASSPGKTPFEKAKWGLTLALGRPATDAQAQTLATLWGTEWDSYRQHPDDSKKLGDTPELAAWTVVSNVLLNLDAVLTKS
ncbi:MAG: DUF1553 domain-containing protein [Armatimonas sp.]